MNVLFHPVAETEFREAVDYYNQQAEGLGFAFALEGARAVQRITGYPDAWPRLSDRTRRCRMLRFPYGIVYQVREEGILIVALMHLHRMPGYWKGRD